MSSRHGLVVAFEDVLAQAVGLILAEQGWDVRHASPRVDAAGGLDAVMPRALGGTGDPAGLVITLPVPDSPVAGRTAAGWDDVAGRRLDSLFVVLRAAMPMLAPGAAIVVILPLPASPHRSSEVLVEAVLAFVRSLAVEAGDREIRVNALWPGSGGGLARSSVGAGAVAGHGPEAADVARVVAFLLSEDASYITGQILHVDGQVSAA